MSSQSIIISTAMSGQTISIRGLSPTLDQAFKSFYDDLMHSREPIQATFDAAAIEYFDGNWANPGALDAYFNNFTPLWSSRVSLGQFNLAVDVWNWALRPAFAWEARHPGQRLHKGTPFYFSAMASVLGKDLDGGYLYAHQALAEDIATHHNSAPQTPSLSFVVMDSTNVNQAAMDWVKAKATWVTSSLTEYRNHYGRSLDFDALRRDFLLKPDSQEAVFLFSYSVARLMRSAEIHALTNSSDFSSQLVGNLFFDLTQVVDAVIHHHFPQTWQFIDLATHLAVKARLALTKRQLGELNVLFGKDFDGTIAGCVSGTLVLADGSKVAGLAAAVAVTYGCRNRGAHNISSNTVFVDYREEILRCLLATLFLAVEAL